MSGRTADLRRRGILVGIPVVIGVIGLGAYLMGQRTAREFEGIAQTQLQTLALRAAAQVTEHFRERTRDIGFLATMPSVIDVARQATQQSRDLSLDRLPTADLEQRFADTRSLGGDSTVQRALIAFRDSSDFVEIFFTDAHGFTVLGTNPTSDFVQSDEEWWSSAMEVGAFESPPTFDQSAGAFGVDIAARITDPVTREGVGVVKATLALSRLVQLLEVHAGLAGATVEVVDRGRRVVASRDEGRLLSLIEDSTVVPRTTETETVALESEDGPEVVTTSPSGDYRWWVVVRQPLAQAYAAARSMRRTVYITAGIAAVLALVLVAAVGNWLHRRITRPVRVAGAAANRIAEGDLSVSIATDTAGSREVEQLLVAIAAMVSSLRKLVADIRSSSQESAAMAQQISASTEEMSASTHDMANTCQELSNQAHEQAELAKRSAGDAARILNISTNLADGAKVAAERSEMVNHTAAEHRGRLMEGSQQLADLASDLERGAEDAERLAALSEQIQHFVTQAKAIASQTNMLALNAAIEASRAGSGEGRGFAVVADEVRKLANQAARSAATTSDVVRNVLVTVQETRSRLRKLAEASTSVRQVAESAAGALEEVSLVTAESSAWVGEISRAADEVNELVEEITQRLQTIAEATDSVVSATEQIAASAEQQSASTQEIAGSAAQLASVSDTLTLAVGSFRVDGAKPTDQKG